MINVGDICVFMNKENSNSDWNIGKILQFGYYLEKTKKARQYTGSFVKCNEDNINKIGIVCSWFHKSSGSSNKHAYVLQTETASHKFIPMNSYICTLPFESFESVEATAVNTTDGMIAAPHASKLTSAKAFTLSSETVLKIDALYKMSTPHSTTNSNFTNSNITLKQNNLTWIQHGSYRLTKHHRSLLCRNGLLDDYHIGTSQFLLQSAFNKTI